MLVSALMTRTVICADFKWDEKNVDWMLRERELGREPLWCLLYKQMGELLNYIMLSARCFCEFASMQSLLPSHSFSSDRSLLPYVFFPILSMSYSLLPSVLSLSLLC